MEHMKAIMASCSYCGGSGIEVYDEGSMRVEADCYHCNGSGTVDEETAFHDCLEEVATQMAVEYVQEYKKYKNECPDGEGFDFCAAENMMTPFDYEKSLVYFYIPVYMDRLDELSHEAQIDLIKKVRAGEVITPL